MEDGTHEIFLRQIPPACGHSHRLPGRRRPQPIPSLEGLLIEANIDLKITGYDLKKGIYTSTEADVTEPGSVVLGARLFGDIVRKLPDGVVFVSSDCEQYGDDPLQQRGILRHGKRGGGLSGIARYGFT
jgi:hypothetical protein